MNLFKSHKIVSAMVIGSIVGHMVHAQEGGEVVNLAGKAQVSNLAAKASSMIDSGCVLVGYFNTPEAMKAQEPDYYSVSPRDVFEDGYTMVGEKQTKVEFQHIQDMANSLNYVYQRMGDSTVTVCCAFLPNGFQVGTGESACVDPASYDKEKGEKLAKERAEVNAINKLWELEGYLLMVTGSTSDKL